jgi:hypothetical protein
VIRNHAASLWCDSDMRRQEHEAHESHEGHETYWLFVNFVAFVVQYRTSKRNGIANEGSRVTIRIW